MISALLLSLLPLASALSQAPAPRTTRDRAGAVYFINNEPSGNMIVSHDIWSDGSLTFAKGVSAGGKGLHGIGAPVPTPTGTDLLFSQSAVTVQGNSLYTVNPGSNTVAMFAIDPVTPSNLTPVGKPVNSSGEFPMSVGVSPNGKTVCVLNGGKVNGISCFNSNPKTGLSPIPGSTRLFGLNQTTPPTGPFNSTTQVFFSEDGNHLLAAVKGIPGAPGFIAVWNVLANGSPSRTFTKTTPPNGALPFGTVQISKTNAFINTDPGVGYTIFDYGSNLRGVAQTTTFPIEGQITTCWTAYNSKFDTYFIIDSGASEIRELSVDKTTLVPTVKGTYNFGNTSGTADSEVAHIKNKSYLYMLATGATSIYTVDVSSVGLGQLVKKTDYSSPAGLAGFTASRSSQGLATYVKPSFASC